MSSDRDPDVGAAARARRTAGGGATLSIAGLEATQATQFYRSADHLDPATAEPDGAVPLIAGKPLAVRIYPDLRLPPGHSGTRWIGGELWYRDAASEGPWRAAFRFPGRVAGRAAAAIDRGRSDHTLNFRIPGAEVRGRLAVRARIWTTVPGAGRLENGTAEKDWALLETPPLRLRLYGVRYRGRGLDLPPPTAAEALATLAFIRRTYPIPGIHLVAYDTFQFGEDLADPSREDSGWRTLLLLLYRLRLAGAGGDLCYALLPRGTPVGPTGGLGSALGVGASRAGEGSTMAQEIAHVLGRAHAPGSGDPAVDPRFPVYGDHPPGSIGEYGFDSSTGEVHSPAIDSDFMTNCGRYWVSPYTYRGLREPVLAMRPLESNDPAPRLQVGFGLGAGGRVEDLRALRLAGPLPAPAGNDRCCSIEIRDGEGRVLASAPAPAEGGMTGEARPLRRHRGSLPFHPGARRLVVRAGDGPEIEAFDFPPPALAVRLLRLDLPAPPLAARGQVELRFTAEAADLRGILFLIRYTADGGRSWTPLDAGLEYGRAVIDLDALPGGDDCRLQIIASTRLETAIAETAPFRVERKPRRAAIAGAGGAPLESEGFLELTGAAHSPDGFAAEEELSWHSDRQGFLGTGSVLFVERLVPGEHLVTLSASDGLGGEARSQLRVRVRTGSWKEP